MKPEDQIPVNDPGWMAGDGAPLAHRVHRTEERGTMNIDLTGLDPEAHDPGPLQINWGTNMDIRALVSHLANATGIDVWGQDDEFVINRERLISDLKSL